MKVDEKVAITADDLIEKGVSDTRGRATVLAPRKVTVQVPAVRKIATGTTKTIQINDRHANDSSVHFYRFQLVHQAPHHFDTVQFIAMYRGGQADFRAWVFPMSNKYRYRRVDTGKRLAGAPVQGLKLAGRNTGIEEWKIVDRRRRFGILLRSG